MPLHFIKLIENRVEHARDDSDSAYFLHLLYLAEVIIKITGCSLIAAIEEDKEKHKYRQIYKIVRADGLGIWAEVINEILVGPTSQNLIKEAKKEQRELTQNLARGNWQYDAVNYIHEALKILKPGLERLPQKVQAKTLFDYCIELRNITRGHGATQISKYTQICSPLHDALKTFIQNFNVFKRNWAYLHRNLSGKFKVCPLTTGTTQFDDLRSSKSHQLQNGVYVYMDSPVHVELIDSDQDLTDFFLPNGAFSEKSYQLLSYCTDSKKEKDSKLFLRVPGELPNSETHGLEEFDVKGKVFSNLPNSPKGYIKRKDLERRLLEILTNERHPIVTLHGRGGIGKTSLALKVLHKLTEREDFGLIIWFSSRDIDLLESGRKIVTPNVLTMKDIINEYCRLMGENLQNNDKNISFFSTSLSQSPIEKPILFVFDNFETVANPQEIYELIDNNIRIPNKVLITTRIGEFRADYPIEVGGMVEKECRRLIEEYWAFLSSPFVLGNEFILKIINESYGHPYVIKILLGQLAIKGREADLPNILAGQDEILEALFERTFVTLSPAAKRIYMTLSSWKSIIPEIALEAVILTRTREQVDVPSAVDELQKSSLVEVYTDGDENYRFISTPLASALFGKKKLSSDSMKIIIEGDLKILYLFGATTSTKRLEGMEKKFEIYFRNIAIEIQNDPDKLEAYSEIIEIISRKYPPGWIVTAKLYEELEKPDSVDLSIKSLKRYIESGHNDISLITMAWKRLSIQYGKKGDVLGEINALVELTNISEISGKEVSDAAHKVYSLLKPEYIFLEVYDRNIIINKLILELENRINELDATDLSRLSWLYLKVKDVLNAKKTSQRGVNLDPENFHCRNVFDKCNRDFS